MNKTNNKTMIKTYDKIANATYIVLNETTERGAAKKTVRVSEHCLVDLDAEGFPLGVEILH